jgi:pimeloyl-ACP methyl ester carboxylesterase
VAALVAASAVVAVAIGYVTTHTGRAVVPPNHLGSAHENVKFTTGDGLELEGWYVPSKNGAAVIAFPGRNGPQAKTRMLARHGYGVLLFDRRGEGRSEGEPNAWGWGGEADIEAAIAYLQRRPDVDPERIGGIGLSVGGEMMIEAAAQTDELAAVVSEGAGAGPSMLEGSRRRDSPSSSSACDSFAPEEVGRRIVTIRATKVESFADFRFSEQTLAHLLQALRARTASRPDNPGLIACWPAVREHQMAAACTELRRRGYSVGPVTIAGRERSRTPDAWALGA